jgi:hypothetical protein
VDGQNQRETAQGSAGDRPGRRNTICNSRAPTDAEYVTRLVPLDARNFRIEFLNEEADKAGVPWSAIGSCWADT